MYLPTRRHKVVGNNPSTCMCLLQELVKISFPGKHFQEGGTELRPTGSIIMQGDQFLFRLHFAKSIVFVG